MKNDFYSDEEETSSNSFNKEAPAKYDYQNNNSFKESTSNNHILDIILIVLFFVIAFLIFLYFNDLAKKKPTDDYEQNSDTTLKYFDVYGGVLEEEFAADVYTYSIIANDSTVTFECIPKQEGVTISGCNDVIDINEGEEKEHKIVVKAIDETQSTYTFKIKSPKNEYFKYIKIELSSTKWTNKNIIVTVTTDSIYGLSSKPYSFDNGKTWQESNTYEVDKNKTIFVLIKDIKGNISDKRGIAISKIDKTIPTIKLSGTTLSGAQAYGPVYMTAVVEPNQCPSEYTYQWYKDGGIIDGAESISYTAKESGNYTFRVKTGAGKKVTSETYIVNIS